MPLVVQSPVWSGTATVTCSETTNHADTCPLLFLTVFAHFTGRWAQLDRLAALRDKGLCCPKDADEPCTFEGAVDADADTDGLRFTCPRCGTEQTSPD